MLPCEKAHWTLIPAIRREFAKVYIEEIGLSQKEAAKRLCISEAAISHYVKGKRGNTSVLNKKTKKYIKKLARSGAKNGEKLICTTCKFAIKQNLC
ncbi:MAG: helix-turn-helix domain-containing protein [Candidatus Diapherotrites archaeon]|nr:helix-turn-helix domain-containing protein [Candidatus Diapherotrites archaeon]